MTTDNPGAGMLRRVSWGLLEEAVRQAPNPDDASDPTAFCLAPSAEELIVAMQHADPLLTFRQAANLARYLLGLPVGSYTGQAGGAT